MKNMHIFRAKHLISDIRTNIPGKGKLGLFSCLLFTLVLNSCLKAGLDDLPTYSDADITEFKFEYRWFDNDAYQMRVFQLTSEYTVDKKELTISCKITVPAAQGKFTDEIRNNVTLNDIVGYCSVSPAASIKPLGNSPKLGVVTDFSSNNFKYQVTAGDGTVKVWTLIISDFIK